MAELTDEEMGKIVDDVISRQKSRESLPATWKLESLLWMGAVMASIALALGLLAAYGFSDWVAGKVQAATNDAVFDKDSDGFKALRDEVALAIATDEFRGVIAKRALPKGAVIIVSDPDGCPESRGWSQHQASKARFIVGVGGAEGLTAKGFNDEGGVEMASLELDQIPAHKHSGSTSNAPDQFRKVGEATSDTAVRANNHAKQIIGGGVSELDLPNADHRHPFETNSVGGGLGHQNMPPYIALYYCERSSE